MELTFAPRDILQIDDARLVYRNFSGEASKFNREGDRDFSVVIPDPDLAQELRDRGWNVKIKQPREDGDMPFMTMKVKVKFNDRGPNVYLQSGDGKPVQLDEESISCLDNVDIARVELDIRPYDWEVNGKAGRTAYLQSMLVVQDVDRFAARFNDDVLPI